MTEPQVSVIIAAYNAASTLPLQLRALARQEGAPTFEVLVCDNGSTDVTAELARQHATQFAQLRVVDASARRGPAAARNIGVAHAQAPFVAFCDADDTVAPHWLASLTTTLQTADAVAGGFEHRRLNSPRAIAVSWGTDIPIRLASWPQLPAGASSNLAVTKEAFDAVEGFDEHLLTCEDIDLSWRLQLAGFALAFAPNAIVHARKRTGMRATYRQSAAYARGTVMLEAKHRVRLGDDVALTHDCPGDSHAALSTPQVDDPKGRFSALVSRLRRPDRLSLLGDAAWRLGQRRAAREQRRRDRSAA